MCLQVEALRKRQKPMSNRAAGRVAKYDKPPTQPVSPLTSRRFRNRRVEFSPKAAKNKWERLEKHVSWNCSCLGSDGNAACTGHVLYMYMGLCVLLALS